MTRVYLDYLRDILDISAKAQHFVEGVIAGCAQRHHDITGRRIVFERSLGWREEVA